MIYITGGKGFIGSYLIKHLGDCIAVPHKEIRNTDFSNATKVFFLSSYGNMSHHTEDDLILQANVTDLVHTLLSVDWSKIESFVFMSTSSVKLKTQTMYSRTKKAAEEILLSFMEKYGAAITVIRPFSVTGVGEQESHLIPTLIRNIKSDETVRLDPTPTHDFIDVEDLILGVMSLSNNKARGIFELGTGVSKTNLEVLRIVEDVVGKKAKIDIVKGLRLYDTEDWFSTNFSSRKYGWTPKKTLRESIEEMAC
jgi:nucleoside-diphosphate-sugar epimerase